MDALKALNTALKRELDGQKYYNQAAVKSSSEKGRRMFEWLSHEETGHIKLLELAIDELKDNSTWLRQDVWGSSGDLTEPIRSSEFPSKPEVMANLPPDAPELEIIKRAIEAEKSDAAFYSKMAESVDDHSGRIMLEKLAQVEEGHSELLEEEYQWIRHSKDLFTLHRFLPAG